MKNDFSLDVYKLKNIIKISPMNFEAHFNFGLVYIPELKNFIQGYIKVNNNDEFNLENSLVKLFVKDLKCNDYFYIVFLDSLDTKYLILPNNI